MARVLSINNLHVGVVDKEGQVAKEILKGVNLEVKTGEIHAIMGPNGTGKSTLAGSIMGYYKYKVTEGTITLDGSETNPWHYTFTGLDKYDASKQNIKTSKIHFDIYFLFAFISSIMNKLLMLK